MKPTYQDGTGNHIFVTKTTKGVEWGFVGKSAKDKTEPLPVDSIIAHMPYTNWQRIETGRPRNTLKSITDIPDEDDEDGDIDEVVLIDEPSTSKLKAVGAPCKPGETSSKTGCTPASGGGGKKPNKTEPKVDKLAPSELKEKYGQKALAARIDNNPVSRERKAEVREKNQFYWRSRLSDLKGGGEEGDDVDLSKITNEQVEEFKQEILKKNQALVDRLDLHMRVGGTALAAIFKDGRFKNQFETGSSNGTYDPDYRKNAEEALFGVSRYEDYARRPIYGYMDDDTGAFGNDAETYGQVDIKFKSDARERATVVFEDSLGADAVGSPVSKLSVESLCAHCRKEEYSSYIEAQIHGGLKTSDIESVKLPQYLIETPAGPGIIDNLKKAGIKYTIKGGDDGEQNPWGPT